ncbi:MAG: hypothetical protein ACE5E6_11760, partial [Phycisphaerae bacterium]
MDGTRRVRVVEAWQHVRQVLYIVPALYVGFGLFFAGRSIFADPPGGDVVLHALIGLLIVSGALGGAIVLSAALRLAVRLSAMHDTVEAIRAQVARLEASTDRDRDDSDAVHTLNLARLGTGDPSVLCAGTVPETVFPRLAAGPPDTASDVPLADTASDVSVADTASDVRVADSALAHLSDDNDTPGTAHGTTTNDTRGSNETRRSAEPRRSAEQRRSAEPRPNDAHPALRTPRGNARATDTGAASGHDA